MFIELDHPQQGKVRQTGIPIKLSETPGAVTRFPPFLGEHTDEVLIGLGYNQSEIDLLRQKGCIK
jgi:crotonobetainyl-CoA:carnitine CoA-transferase CaiB-like acyl-CoA transferase